MGDLRPEGRRFIFELPYFLSYLQQDKLFYLLGGLAAANILALVPIPFWPLLVSVLLFLAAYKVAFELLLAVAEGDFEFRDRQDLGVGNTIGFKAFVPMLLVVLVVTLVLPNHWLLGVSLSVGILFFLPAYLMLLSQSQSVSAALNPLALVEVVVRVGLDYVLLAAVVLLLSWVRDWLEGFLLELEPQWLVMVVFYFVAYYLLAFMFVMMGYVIYSHADDLGVVLPDVEDVTGKIDLDAGDPVRQRVVELIGNQRPQEALQVVEELEREGRGDLGVLKAQAMNLLRLESHHSAAQQWQQLIERKQWREAAEFWKSADDVDALVLSGPEPVARLIDWCHERHYDGLAVQLCLSLEKHYPDSEQMVVDYLFLAAKLLYQNKQVLQAVRLLERTIGRYQQRANVGALQSYLTGLHKMDKIGG